MKYNWIKKVSLVFAFGAFVSCDKDYNTIGSDLLGTQTFDFLSGEDKSEMLELANLEASKVQSNNLVLNQLGVYPNHEFGTTTASVISQLSLAELGKEFAKDQTADSVVLSIPYFSTKLATDAKGRSTYRLDSIFTNNKDYYVDFKSTKLPKIKFEVFRNNFALNDLDTDNPANAAKYYSNQTNILNQVGVNIATTNLEFNQAEFEQPKVDGNNKLLDIKDKPENVQARFSPRIRVKLDKAFFETLIMSQANKAKIKDNEVFKDYFRGITLKVSSLGAEGTLAMLDLKKADVTMYYTEAPLTTTSVGVMKSFVMNFSGNTVNILDTPQINKSSDKLYLKGGQGAITTLTIKDDLIKELKSNKALLNDASLYFTVDPSYVAKLSQAGSKSFNFLNPMRLYLFDYENKSSIVDYFSDTTNSFSFPKKNKSVFGGILQKVGDKYMYRIRITDHLNRILTDNTGKFKNVKLGLCVTEDIRFVPESLGVNSMFTAFVNGKESFFPVASVLNPLGTVLGGGTGAEKVQLKISYTKPN